MYKVYSYLYLHTWQRTFLLDCLALVQQKPWETFRLATGHSTNKLQSGSTAIVIFIKIKSMVILITWLSNLLLETFFPNCTNLLQKLWLIVTALKNQMDENAVHFLLSIEKSLVIVIIRRRVFMSHEVVRKLNWPSTTNFLDLRKNIIRWTYIFIMSLNANGEVSLHCFVALMEWINLHPSRKLMSLIGSIQTGDRFVHAIRLGWVSCLYAMYGERKWENIICVAATTQPSQMRVWRVGAVTTFRRMCWIIRGSETGPNQRERV